MDPLELSGPRFLALPATRERTAGLQACLDGAPGYFERVEGGPAAPDAAARLLDEAEADPERQVLVLAARGGGHALGVLDLYLHHPEPEVAHVALLLLREAAQGHGLGREVVEALSRALAGAGFTELRASVGDENPGARAFWQHVGFEPVGRLDRRVTIYALRLA
jgi:GNAT superfamily N-acetyltransferase